jgi:hypothetical protein
VRKAAIAPMVADALEFMEPPVGGGSRAQGPEGRKRARLRLAKRKLAEIYVKRKIGAVMLALPLVAVPRTRLIAPGMSLHGIGTGTATPLSCVNNHRPSIFLALPTRATWLTAVQNGNPVAGFNATSK